MRVKNNSDVDKAKNTSFICSDCSSLFGRCVLSYLYVFRDFLWIWKATEFWEVNIFNSLDTCFIMLIYIAEQNVGYQWHYLFLFTHNSGYGCVHVLYIHTYNTEHTHIHETTGVRMIVSILQIENLSLKFGRGLIWGHVRVTQSPSTIVLHYKCGLGQIKLFSCFVLVRKFLCPFSQTEAKLSSWKKFVVNCKHCVKKETEEPLSHLVSFKFLRKPTHFPRTTYAFNCDPCLESRE